MAADKVQYIIEVTKQGEGATEAIDDFQKVEAASEKSNATIAAGAAASTNAVKAGTKDIKNALQLIAITAFPQAAQAGLLFKGTMDLTRASATALGVGLTSAAVSLVAVGAAAVTAYQGIKLLNAETVKNTTSTALAGANERLFQTLKQQIAAKLASNELSAAGAEQLEKELMASIKLRDNTAKEFEALKKVGDKLLDLRSAHEAVADIAVAATQETLTGLARQLQTLQDIFEARKKEIELVEKSTGANLSREFNEVLAAGSTQRELALQTTWRMLQLKAQSNEVDQRQLALDFDTANAQREINELKAAGLLLDSEALDLQESLNAAVANQQEMISVARLEQNEYFRVAQQGVQSFAGGFSQAIVGALSGGKQAFREFFSQFFKQMAAAILQATILRAIFSALTGTFGVSSGVASSLTGVAQSAAFNAAQYANGGVRFAANGIQTVSQPTYFPKFNVVAGEAGSEMLTVLARPRMMDIGGLAAAVGSAGNSRLAITDADALQARGNGGAKSVVEVRLSPGLEASLIQQAREGAVITVTQQLTQDSQISRNVKGLVS